jgi:hypothetical protein
MAQVRILPETSELVGGLYQCDRGAPQLFTRMKHNSLMAVLITYLPHSDENKMAFDVQSE